MPGDLAYGKADDMPLLPEVSENIMQRHGKNPS
jgi:hypothetical protein